VGRVRRTHPSNRPPTALLTVPQPPLQNLLRQLLKEGGFTVAADSAPEAYEAAMAAAAAASQVKPV
jgi:hypothetical protein